jgi:predicted metalloprotease with PDZ domain
MKLKALLLALVAIAPAWPASAAEPSIQIALAPGAPEADGQVRSLDVAVTLDQVQAGPNGAVLRIGRLISNVVGAAETLQDLQATDAKGALTLTAKDDPDGEAGFRHFLPSRPVEGQLTVHYRVPITNALNLRGAAPPLELRSEDGGISGAGGTFLVLPEVEQPRRITVRWDLSRSGPGAVGLSNFGLGEASGEAAKPGDTLMQTYFMGGAVHAYSDTPPKNGFFSAWQGRPPFDARALMQWTEKLYGYDVGFFQAPPTPFGVFLRRNLINAGGGVEMGGSFVGTFDKDPDVEDFKSTLAHEMVHAFVGSLDQPGGLEGSWYTEGLAVYYERVLPLRAGVMDADSFLQDLNSTAARYYTDIKNDAPNSEVPKRFWADTRIRVLPYDRGALYFATVDEQVRKASGGKRSLDDLVLEMIGKRRGGVQLTQALWLELVTRELGEPGRQQFRDMLAGKLMLPGPGAFGPCFTRTTRPLRRYELGFDTEVLVQPRKIIHGLVAGSAAEKAGVRNGDEIVKPVPQDRIQGDQTATITLQIRRDDQILTVTYLPRGEMMDAYQWQKTSAAAKGHCAI